MSRKEERLPTSTHSVRTIARALSEHSRRRKYTLLCRLLRSDPRVILDVASGDGGFLEKMLSSDSRARHLLDRLIAIDIRPTYLARLRARYASPITIQADALHLPFADRSVDLVCCNALLEHIPYDAQRQLVEEIQRVARHYWIATPSRSSFIETHYGLPVIGWLKPPLRDRLLKELGRQLHNDPINLLTMRQFRRLFTPEVTCQRMFVFPGVEHLIAIRD